MKARKKGSDLKAVIISFFRYVDYLVLYHLYWHFVLNMVSNRIKENHLLKEEEELDDVDLKKKKRHFND